MGLTPFFLSIMYSTFSDLSMRFMQFFRFSQIGMAGRSSSHKVPPGAELPREPGQGKPAVLPECLPQGLQIVPVVLDLPAEPAQGLRQAAHRRQALHRQQGEDAQIGRASCRERV